MNILALGHAALKALTLSKAPSVAQSRPSHPEQSIATQIAETGLLMTQS
jgi:hypothetical protein